MKILVTGADGQLGQCFKKLFSEQEEIDKLFPENEELSYYLTNKSQLDIASDEAEKIITDIRPNIIINCAAYVNTEGAEYNQRVAFLANTYGPINLATICNKHGIKLVHISTDFVFDGEKNTPYKEFDACRPINTYGSTKYYGEEGIRSILVNHVIVRTSWLYSEFGNNFLTKTLDVLRKGEKRFYVYDQIASPTYAMNLARFVLEFATKDTVRGTYHFTDAGVASRYDFAKEIELLYTGDKGIINPCLSDTMEEKVKRPMYSVLSGDLIIEHLGAKRVNWQLALSECMGNMFLTEKE